ncbi:MAG: HTH domain-containing protein [bacterium]
MNKRELASIMEQMSVAELKDLVAKKGKLDELTGRRRELEKGLTEVERQIADLIGSKAPAPKATRAARAGARARRAAPKPRKRIRQPSLSSVVLSILKENKKPLKISDIATQALEQKKYKTQAKNFKGQLRIVLYKNEKGLFKKMGPGLFAASPAAAKAEK